MLATSVDQLFSGVEQVIIKSAVACNSENFSVNSVF